MIYTSYFSSKKYNKEQGISISRWNKFWDGYVFETEKEAVAGGCGHLMELADEGELRGDPDDYTVDAVAISLSEVPTRTLAFSNLDHLI